MELPVIKTEEVTKTIELGNNIFVLRPWKTKDEKNFMIKQALLSKKKQESEKDLEKLLVEELVKPCIVDGDISKIDYNGLRRIIVELRCISIGDDIRDVNYKCTKCEKANSLDISLSEDGVINYKAENSEIQEINDSLSIRFKTVPFSKMESTIEEYDYIYLGIDEIIYEDTSYKDFSKENFEQFFDSFDLTTSKKITEKLIESSSELEIKKTVNCLHCDEENEIDLGSMSNFYLP